MKWSYPAWCIGIIVLIAAPVTLRVLSWPEEQSQQASEEDIQDGKILFTHEWTAKDPLCPNGDGVGPVYNATSCAACHRQGGLGGAGGEEHNVTTFVIEPSDPRGKVREGVIHAHAISPEYQETLALLNPGLPEISRPTLKQLGVPRKPNDDQDLNDRVEVKVKVEGEQAPLMDLAPNVVLAQRNTPPLFGVGLIDSIPDRVILANARKQRLRHGLAPGDTETVPVGRPGRLAGGKIGKFGWKAQAASLSEFVQAACANEVGLGNPNHDQPRPMGQPNYKNVGLDLTQKQCDQMTAFVASLDRPQQRLPEDPGRRADAEHGKREFNKLGCANCHTEKLGSVSGIYSDLLLHRMGHDLESRGSSYGGSPPAPSERSPGEGPLSDEWRTPPLWGVADSGPYMHDGRAVTLEDAIRMHGGQGKRAARRFKRSSPREQEQLISFLKTLRAPGGRPR